MGFLKKRASRFRSLKNKIDELKLRASACSSGGGGGPTRTSTGGPTTTVTGYPPPLGSGGNEYQVYQDVGTEQTQLNELEKSLTKERLDELESKARLQNAELAKAFSTKSSKSLYQTEQISSLNWSVYYLIWTYAVIAVIFLGFLFAGPKSKKISIYIKILATILLLLYPYYITTLQDWIYDFSRFGSNILYGNVYLQSEY